MYSKNGDVASNNGTIATNGYSETNGLKVVGQMNQEVVDTYSDWATKYDADLFSGCYNGPSIVAKSIENLYNAELRPTVRILDVAAGTGQVGHELNLLGFRNIDALEPSTEMLKVLRGKNVYTNIFETAIGFKVVDGISPNVYDTLVIAGGMGEGHIPVTAIDEMIRIVKPGGTIVILMREEYLEKVKDYAGKLEPYMESLQGKGFWKQMSRAICPDYSYNQNGVLYMYEVTSIGHHISS